MSLFLNYLKVEKNLLLSLLSLSFSLVKFALGKLRRVFSISRIPTRGKYKSKIREKMERRLGQGGSTAIRTNDNGCIRVHICIAVKKYTYALHTCEPGAAYSSLPKFSLHGANVEFLCKIHAAKYVTARDASRQDKIAPAGLPRTRQKFETILGMQSQNVELKMRPRNFTHITARMPLPWGVGRWGCRRSGESARVFTFPRSC